MSTGNCCFGANSCHVLWILIITFMVDVPKIPIKINPEIHVSYAKLGAP